MQIVPSTRSSTSRQAGQLPMSPPPGQAVQTPPMHKFMDWASNYIFNYTNTHTEWPDYYAFRDHNNLATQCTNCILEAQCMNLCMARGRGHGQLAVLPAGRTPDPGDNLHIILLLYRIYTEWPDYYAFRGHNNLATQCIIIWPLSV